MKKIALVLALVMLISLFAGCKEPNDISDTLSTSEASRPTTDDSTDTSKPEEEKIPVENPENASVISTGKPYTNTATPGEAYPDSYTTELTDGQFAFDSAGDYTDAKYSGYTDSTVYVTIDLGQVYDTIYEFRCSYLHSNMSLEVFLEKMGVEDLKQSGEEFDYSKIRYPWTPLSDQEMKYIVNDVKGLVEALTAIRFTRCRPRRPATSGKT